VFYKNIGENLNVAADYVNQNSGEVFSFTDSPLAPSTQYAKLTFTISTNGISIFDSYTAWIALLNALVAQLIKDTEKTTCKRQGAFENLYQHFDIFLSLKRWSAWYFHADVFIFI